MNEVWKDVLGYEGLYQVSNLGQVRSLERYRKNHVGVAKVQGKILRQSIKNSGYAKVALCKDGKVKTFTIHRMVAQAFVENVDGKTTVNHINGNKLDNRAENLEWTTYAENNMHAIDTGLNKMGVMNNKSSRPVAQYDLDMNLIKVYPSIKEAERQTGVINQKIIPCCKGKFRTGGGFIWKYA